ncbi:MAG: DNA integrity scanning diadenylate cyclase DisA [Atopobiaceae bacterium]|nr:DNA integrity scanning diadenylate cyclase DisA [Atopobiaceae bacterium]
MDDQEAKQEAINPKQRREQALRMCAPGTALRTALDMIIAGHLGALITIGDEDAVIAAGTDGFKLDVSFTASRLFELCKMDGAVVIDKDITKILRANFHLNPDPTLPTAETGTRHRTAARMSLLTDAIVISISERRQVVNVYVDGKGSQLRPTPEVMSTATQLTGIMQSTREQLDRQLLRLSTLELNNFVTLADVSSVIYLCEMLMTSAEELDGCLVELGRNGRVIDMQRQEYAGTIDEEYTLLIRDYALDSSEANAAAIREEFRKTPNDQLRTPRNVARILGYDDLNVDSIMTPLGLRTLNRVSVVRKGMADKIIDEYGSLQDIVAAVDEDPAKLEEVGVNNPDVLADSLHRMWGRR